jgi:hypothetical protein
MICLFVDGRRLVSKMLHPRSSFIFFILVLIIFAPIYTQFSVQIPNTSNSNAFSSTEYQWIARFERQAGLEYMQIDKMWNRTYSNSMYDIGYGIVECRDGGFAMTGATQQIYMELGHRYNVWLIRTDAHGNVLWNASFGQLGYDGGYDLIECPDSGFAIVGYSMNNQSDVSDIFVVRTNAWGVLLWNRTYRATGSDLGYSIIWVRAGGFAVLGSLKFRETGLLRIDEEGSLLWNQTFPVPSIRTNKGLVECPDGGFAFIANNDPLLWSNVGLFRTDANGRMLWNRTYGGAGTYSGRGLVLCSDGGFAIVGGICNVGTDNWNIWLVRTDSQGTLLWNQSFGSSEYEIAYSLTQIRGGGFACTGIITTDEGFHNIRLVITDASGEALLNHIIVWSGNCRAHSIVECKDRGLALTGGTDKGDTGMNLILFRIPGNQNSIFADRVAWIIIVLVLPLVTSVIVVWVTLHFLRSKVQQTNAKVL